MTNYLTGSPRRAGYADAADFMRPACAFLIAWFHIWQQSWQNPNLVIGGKLILNLYPLVSAGYMFVDLMLLLSGFLLMLGALERKERPALEFYKARFARVYPSYLFCLLILFFVFALPEHLYGSGRHMRIDVFAHLTFTHTLFRESYHGTQLGGVLWTLSVEVMFYAVFPLLGKAFRKKPYLTFALMTIAAWVSRHFAANSGDIVFFVNQFPTMLDVYACGMMAAYVLHRLGTRRPNAIRTWISTLLTILSVAAICFIVELQSHRSGQQGVLQLGQLLYRFPLAVAGGVFLVCGSRAALFMRKLFSNGLTRFLGGISFNFYIWHQFLAVKLKQWHIPPYTGENPNFTGQQPWQWQYTLICFGVALLSALIGTYLIEKPCAKMLRGKK